MPKLEDGRDLDDFVTELVDDEIGLDKFQSYDLEVKRKVQAIVLTKEVLREGLAEGLDAVDAAVQICKQTKLGVGLLMGQKLSMLLATALQPTTHRDADSSEDIFYGCEILLDEMRRHGP